MTPGSRALGPHGGRRGHGSPTPRRRRSVSVAAPKLKVPTLRKFRRLMPSQKRCAEPWNANIRDSSKAEKARRPVAGTSTVGRIVPRNDYGKYTPPGRAMQRENTIFMYSNSKRLEIFTQTATDIKA